MATQLSLSEAVGRIQPGQRVLMPPACGLPTALTEELGRQASRFAGDKLEVMGGYCLTTPPYLDERFAESFHYRTLHPAGAAAGALARGQASYVPMRYFDTLRLFARDGALSPDVLCVHVAPPDKQGRYSLGVSPSYPGPLARDAALVIAQVNPQMPRTLGCYLEEDDIDLLVHCDEPVLEYRTAAVGDRERQIAAHVASLVADGATLQTGLGSIPEALLGQLTDKRDLVLYSLLVDSALALFEAGAVRASAICEIMGSRQLFDFADSNPAVTMVGSDVVHAPAHLAGLPCFTSVLSAVEVDLSGQVNAESVGARAVGGIGGQLDFAMGAALNPEGTCIVALPARAGRNADHSRIVARLSEGAAVTTPRSLVQYVVTEYGVADLRGKSLTERAKALTAIAAPEFRQELSRWS